MNSTDTEAELRKQIKALLKFGVTKRALAEVMEVQDSWLGRWLAGSEADVQVRAINVREMDRFERWRRAFLKQLQADTTQETQRSEPSSAAPARHDSDAVGERFPESGRKRRAAGR
jgi:hypothetical protein